MEIDPIKNIASGDGATTISPALQVLLFALSFLIFIATPVYTVPADPKYTILVSESLLKYHTPALNAFVIPGLDVNTLPAHPRPIEYRPFYQLVRIDGRVLHRYPPGTPILAAPFVALMHLAGLSASNPDGTYNRVGEIRIQRLLASLLMALLTWILFRTAALLLPISWSLVVACAAAFGTQVLSTATRSLGTHTFEILLSGIMLYAILKTELRRSQLHPIILATLLSWMFFVRPTGVIPVAAVTIFVLLRYRRDFPLYAVTGAFWLGAFIAYSRVVTGQFLPDYYHEGAKLSITFVAQAIAANLISPSRGLFIFVPPVMVVIYLVARHWRTVPQKPFAVLAMGVIITQIVLISTWPVWWGGTSYGPRLLTDLVPWFAILGILGCAGLRQYCIETAASRAEDRSRYRKVVLATAMALVMIGVAINTRGAVSWQTAVWGVAVNIDYHPERVWDWRNPQFTAGLLPSSGDHLVLTIGGRDSSNLPR
jgi:hypothetical protein